MSPEDLKHNHQWVFLRQELREAPSQGGAVTTTVHDAYYCRKCLTYQYVQVQVRVHYTTEPSRVYVTFDLISTSAGAKPGRAP